MSRRERDAPGAAEDRREAQDLVKKADSLLEEAVRARVQAGNALVIEELRHFATWVPGMFPRERRAEHDDGEGVEDEDEEERLHDVPFFSETYLYALMGKEEGRTVLALFSAVCRAVGVRDYDELQAPWFEWQRQEDREHAAALHRKVAERTGQGHTFGVGCKLCVADGGRKSCRGLISKKALEQAAKILKARWGEDVTP